MRTCVPFLLTWLVGSAFSQSLGDPALESRALRGIDYVYNLEFERAESEFNEIVRQRPNDPAGYALLAIVDWWRIQIDMDDTRYDKHYTDLLERAISLADDLLDKNEDDVNALFFKGGAIGFLGRLKFHRDDWIGAANAGRRALPIVQTASSLDPANYDIHLGTGIYNYYAEVIPEEYPIVKPLLLFIPPGDKKKGIEQLQAAAEKGKFARVEAAYFLMQTYYNYEKNYLAALALAEELHKRYPSNMLFHKYVGRCNVSLGNWLKVAEVFTEVIRRVRNAQPGYGKSAEREAEYYLGMHEMQTRRHDVALNHFYRCDELSRDLDFKEASGFMVMANLKVGMIYDVQTKRDLAVMQYTKVLSMKEFKDSHKQAEKYKHAPYVQ